MYICPTCNEQFKTEADVTQHMLKCWKAKHPYHQSKPAPRSEDINTREINSDVAAFFNAFAKEN